jgi:hypothetical protein
MMAEIQKRVMVTMSPDEAKYLLEILQHKDICTIIEQELGGVWEQTARNVVDLLVNV